MEKAPCSSRSVHFASGRDDWPTPGWLFDVLDEEFSFTLDPCSTHENAKCNNHYTVVEDGLSKNWGSETVFMNPPYGRSVGRWMMKAYESSIRGATVVCLIPARTDTKWWHEFAMRGDIFLFRGRIRFEGAHHAAPFPSAIVIFWARKGTSIQKRKISGRQIPFSSFFHFKGKSCGHTDQLFANAY